MHRIDEYDDSFNQYDREQGNRGHNDHDYNRDMRTSTPDRNQAHNAHVRESPPVSRGESRQKRQIREHQVQQNKISETSHE